jgi:hypothetical protein
VVVFAVYAQVLSKVVYPLGEQSDLNLGGARVLRVLLVELNNLGFSLCCEHSGPQAFLVSIFLYALTAV